MSVSPELVIPSRRFNTKQLGAAFYMALVAFLTYASVYAFRKPFTAATFDGIKFWGLPYQTLLIISQVVGYMFSKFAGIKVIAELKRFARWKAALLLVSVAWLCLLFFALVPAPYGMLFFFINGFSLGFLWGIVFSYIEGRRATDFIGSVLAISFIFAGGFTRSVALWLRDYWQMSESWMPFMTGLIFLPFLMLFVFLLERIPAPTQEDVAERMQRKPMTMEDRKKLFTKFSFGLIIVTLTYLFLTVMRDIRDNFMANIWNELGYTNNYAVFTNTELKTSLIILMIVALLSLVRKNMKAFRIVHLVIMLGFALSAISSWLFINNLMDGAVWMQLVGLGLYMAYIPFNCIFFERLIATFRIAGNVGFLIYIADAFGYLGSVGVMITKEILNLKLNWSQFYSQAVVFGGLIGVAGTIASYLYFARKYRH